MELSGANNIVSWTCGKRRDRVPDSFTARVPSLDGCSLICPVTLKWIEVLWIYISRTEILQNTTSVDSRRTSQWTVNSKIVMWFGINQYRSSPSKIQTEISISAPLCSRSVARTRSYHGTCLALLSSGARVKLWPRYNWRRYLSLQHSQAPQMGPGLYEYSYLGPTGSYKFRNSKGEKIQVPRFFREASNTMQTTPALSRVQVGSVALTLATSSNQVCSNGHF